MATTISRRKVPKVLKDRVWDVCVGKEKGVGQCYVCAKQIDSKNFHCGHIVSVYDGGPTQLDNLKPICSVCNSSMGTQNLEEFKARFFTPSSQPQTMCFFNKDIHDLIDDVSRTFLSHRRTASGLRCGVVEYAASRSRVTKEPVLKSFNQSLIARNAKTKDSGVLLVGNVAQVVMAIREAKTEKTHVCEKCASFAKTFDVAAASW